MKLPSWWCFLLTVVFGASPLFAQTASFQFSEAPGPYPVGLKVVAQYDGTRSFPSATGSGKPPARTGARPLQTLVWYPAAQGTGHPMTVGDYAGLADTEIAFDIPTPEQNRWRELLKTSLDVRLRAVRDAKAARGRYPVVVYAPSDSSVSWENADLCEYLASHGYVVIAGPSLGASTRDMTDDLKGIDAQARDITYLITYAETLPDADPSKVAVVSWSWGGIASLFAAARDPRIKALASMDGSMRYFPGLVRAGGVHPDRMTVPLLFFTSEYPNFLEDLEKYDDGAATDKTGPNVLNAWKRGDLITANMIGMSHGEFGAMIQRRKSAQRFAEDQVADYDRGDANTGYAWVTRYILKFLDARLKADAAAEVFLRRAPAENGVPRHFMASNFRAAEETSPSSPKAPVR